MTSYNWKSWYHKGEPCHQIMTNNLVLQAHRLAALPGELHPWGPEVCTERGSLDVASRSQESQQVSGCREVVFVGVAVIYVCSPASRPVLSLIVALNGIAWGFQQH